ncbi:hypothetical protein, partial [Klebsiella pneumoniae]|uniref:hypothetical protein n=1 Tax=Klebsiella pneumoniae TaxID=573 RepID=UPI001C6F6050
HDYLLTCKSPSELFAHAEFDAIHDLNFATAQALWFLDIDYQLNTLSYLSRLMVIIESSHLNAL